MSVSTWSAWKQTAGFSRIIRTFWPSAEWQDLPLLKLDAVLVEQLFANLFENAAKHAGIEAQVRITADQKANGNEVRVADNGPGFPEGEAGHLFEKFHKGGGTGFGLGLAIAEL